MNFRNGHVEIDLWSKAPLSIWEDVVKNYVFFMDATGGLVSTKGIENFLAADTMKAILNTCVYVTPKKRFGLNDCLGKN